MAPDPHTQADAAHRPDALAQTTAGAPVAGFLRRELPIAFLARTTVNTPFRIIYPFLPSIARGLGISVMAAGGLTSLRFIAGLAAPLLGPLADRYARRRVMEVALLLLAVASLVLGSAGTFAAAAIAFAIYGLAKALYDPAVHGYLGEAVSYQKRSRAVGLLELSWSCALLFGGPIAGILIERFGWRAPWAVLLVLGLAGLGLTRAGLPLAPPRRAHADDKQSAVTLAAAVGTTWRDLLRRRSVVALLITAVLLTLAIEVPFIMYGEWLEATFGLSLTSLGIASIVVGLAEATAELGSAALTDRLGKRRSVLAGLLGLAASLIALPYLARLGLVAALAGVALMMLTFEFGLVSLLPLATELATDARSTLFSLTLMAFSLSRILGALIGGWLWQWQSIALHASVGAACALAAAAVLALGIREIQT